MKGKNNIPVIVISCLAGLILFLAAGEIYTRLTYKQSYLAGFMVEDPVFHHLPPPHYRGGMYSEGDFDLFFVTNNRGMRGPGDYDYKKKDNVFRIAVLGDSFTFGVGVKEDETASYLLEKLLNGSGSGRYEVYNFGVNSYSPILEYIYLTKEAVRYDPDTVILMLDICDPQDDYLYEPHIVYGERGDILGCDPMRVNGKPDIEALCMKYSRLFYILDQKLFQSFRKIKTIGFRRYISNKFNGIRNKQEILLNRDIDNIYFDRFLMFREGKDRNIVMRHWERTAKYIVMIKGYLDERRIKFLLVTYPYGHQVGEGQWAKGRRYWGFEDNRVYDPKDGFAIIKGFAERNGIDLLNLYDAMAKNRKEKLYFNNDGHWTQKGQETAAKTIFDSLTTETLSRNISSSDEVR